MMKKKLLCCILFASIFGLLLTSCPSSKTHKESEETKKKDIIIKEVKLGTFTCIKGRDIYIDGAEATLKIEFKEKYEGLQVKVNNEKVTLTDKIATKNITNITEAGQAISIVATAKGYNDASFNFTAKKNVSSIKARVESIVFEGNGIAGATGSGNANVKEYSHAKAPLLSEITEDGMHKVGTVSTPKLKVKVKHTNTAKDANFILKNKTTNVKVNGTSVTGESSLFAELDLQKGDNKVEIAYTEKDKTAVTYKVVVGCVEEPYEPIISIKLGANDYSGSVNLAKLETGSEKLEVDEKDEILVKVKMPELYYDQTGWKLEIADEEIKKGSTAFKASGTSTVTYTASKNVSLNKGAEKEVQIKFTNAQRNYNKVYKATVKHIVLNKIDFIRIINVTDTNNKEQLNNKVFGDFDLDGVKQYYKAKEAVSLKAEIAKCTFLILGQDQTIEAKYAFKDSDAGLPEDSQWQSLTKKSVTYKGVGGNTTVEAYALEDRPTKTGSEFLFVMLEKDGFKTFYCEEIKKPNVLSNNTDRIGKQYIYQDENAMDVTEGSPLAKKGLIKVKPKSPNATVKLLTPKEELFVKKQDGWHEATIDLITAETSFTYDIIAEDTTTKKTYSDANQKFVKKPLVIKLEFAYKGNPGAGEKKTVKEIDGKYHIAVDKSKVGASDKKIYFWLKTFKDAKMEKGDFTDVTSFEGSAKFATDVSNVIDVQDGKKTCNATLKIGEKEAGTLTVDFFQASDVIKNLEVHGAIAQQVSSDKWVCKADIDGSADKKLKVNLFVTEGKTVTDTKQIVEVYNNSSKLDVVKDAGTTDLIFTHDSLEIQDKGTITLQIKYWSEGDTNQSPTKTFTLEIKDI